MGRHRPLGNRGLFAARIRIDAAILTSRKLSGAALCVPRSVEVETEAKLYQRWRKEPRLPGPPGPAPRERGPKPLQGALVRSQGLECCSQRAAEPPSGMLVGSRNSWSRSDGTYVCAMPHSGTPQDLTAGPAHFATASEKAVEPRKSPLMTTNPNPVIPPARVGDRAPDHARGPSTATLTKPIIRPGRPTRFLATQDTLSAGPGGGDC